MKKLILFSLFLALTISFSAIGCITNSHSNYSDSKEVKRQVRELESFSGIRLSISADVILVQGTPQRVEMEGKAEDLERITTEIKNNALEIKRDNSFFSNLGKVKIYITVANIESLSVSGSGNITASDAVKTNHLDMHVSGSGNISLLNLAASDLESHVSGSGDILLKGNGTKAAKHSIHISGSGDIDAENIETEVIDASISGSGTCKVFSSGNIDAHVSGSGDVFYKGKPVVNARVSGSGKVQSI